MPGLFTQKSSSVSDCVVCDKDGKVSEIEWTESAPSVSELLSPPEKEFRGKVEEGSFITEQKYTCG
jgi:hypothetical protein